MRNLSPAALRAMFSPEADDTLICLLTLANGKLEEPVRLADNWTERLAETDEDILYGVKSRGDEYVFMPFQIALPTEEHAAAPRARITIHDVTRHLTPVIRQITGALNVTLELVLKSEPDVVEVSYPGLLLSGITYNADTVTGELTVESLAAEPFPCHTLTPSIAPGLF